MTTRRDFAALYLTGGAAALLAAGCTPQQVDNTQQQITNIINQVQAGVAKACTAAGKIIPTANTVLAVLTAIVGGTNATLATATMIAQAITEIAAVGCPATPPPPTAAKTAKGVLVAFY
jgi:hypothetical protein